MATNVSESGRNPESFEWRILAFDLDHLPVNKKKILIF